MIEFTQSDLRDLHGHGVEAMVNTVNTVGIMGKGVALMFKGWFPRNFKEYERACKIGEVRIGKMFVTENVAENETLAFPGFEQPPREQPTRWIINFPTKEHWRSKTRIEWVREGLDDLVRVIREKNIRSIAIPALGCGNGGLDWHDVRPLIESALEKEDVRAIICEPVAGREDAGKRSGTDKWSVA